MRRTTAIVMALLSGAGSAAAQQAQSFRADYSVTLFGLPIARSTFVSRFQAERFSVEGSLSSAGVAELFDRTRGTVRASGQVSAEQARPQSFRLEYESGKKKQLTAIRFARGEATETVNEPPLKKRGDDWVPLRKADLASVADPISATLVRARSLQEVCGRTIRGYDGEMRANLELTPMRQDEVSVPGYKGRAITCRARFVPVSGYARNRSAIHYLRDRSRITITFAPLGETGVYAPIRATVGTRIGTVTVQARRFEPVR